MYDGGLVAQAVRCSPPTAGVPSSHLGPSMWVSWWTKRGLGRFFTGFLPFSPTSNFIPPFLHTHPFRFISSALVMVLQAWSAGTHATHGPIMWGLHRISSLDPPCIGYELTFIYLWSFAVWRSSLIKYKEKYLFGLSLKQILGDNVYILSHLFLFL